MPKACPRVTYEEMFKCWKTKPEERPTFNDLSIHFETADEYADIRDVRKMKGKN